MNINNTNPDDPPDRYTPRKIDWDWRDAVTAEFTNVGVDPQTSQVIVIDMRQGLDVCAKHKLSPTQTVSLLITAVERLYNNGKAY